MMRSHHCGHSSSTRTKPQTLQQTTSKSAARDHASRIKGYLRSQVAAVSSAKNNRYPASNPTPNEFEDQVRRAVASFCAATVITLGACCGPAYALQPEEPLQIRFPASSNPEIRKAQRTLVEAWAYVRELYVDDQQLVALNWDDAIKEALGSSFQQESSEAVLDLADKLLSELDDPFTRILRSTSDEKQQFEAELNGQIVSTGLSTRVQDGRLLVAYLAPRSAAEASGLQEGDEILTVDGVAVTDLGLEEAQKKLLKGSPKVTARSRDAVSESGEQQDEEAIKFVELQAQPVPFATVLYGLVTPQNTPAAADDAQTARTGDSRTSLVSSDSLQADNQQPPRMQYVSIPSPNITTSTSTPSGASSDPSSTILDAASTQQPSYGYIKVVIWSRNVGEQVSSAVQELKSAGVQGFILDFRNNPGGIVESGLDFASLLLPPGDVFVVTHDRTGQDQQVIISPPGSNSMPTVQFLADNNSDQSLAEPTQTPIDTPSTSTSQPTSSGTSGSSSTALTMSDSDVPPQLVSTDASSALASNPTPTPPIVVLLNRWSASTSEMVAGALRDDGGALLLGEPSFGKGRSQAIIPLSDGPTLLVSSTEYYTPSGTLVDKKGLQPDAACSIPDTTAKMSSNANTFVQPHLQLLNDDGSLPRIKSTPIAPGGRYANKQQQQANKVSQVVGDDAAGGGLGPDEPGAQSQMEDTSFVDELSDSDPCIVSAYNILYSKTLK